MLAGEATAASSLLGGTGQAGGPESCAETSLDPQNLPWAHPGRAMDHEGT